jgi:hypothetical protein
VFVGAADWPGEGVTLGSRRVRIGSGALIGIAFTAPPPQPASNPAVATAVTTVRTARIAHPESFDRYPSSTIVLIDHNRRVARAACSG